METKIKKITEDSEINDNSCQSLINNLIMKMNTQKNHDQYISSLEKQIEMIIGCLYNQLNRIDYSGIDLIKKKEIRQEIQLLLQITFNQFIDWYRATENHTTKGLLNHIRKMVEINMISLSKFNKIEVLNAVNYNLENDFPIIISILNPYKKTSEIDNQQLINQLRCLCLIHLQRRLDHQMIFYAR